MCVCQFEKMVGLDLCRFYSKTHSRNKHIINKNILETVNDNVCESELLNYILGMLTDMQLPLSIFFLLSP